MTNFEAFISLAATAMIFVSWFGGYKFATLKEKKIV